MKVVELTIDDLEDFGGLDAISIVNKPAHESNFLSFKDDGETPIYEHLDADQLNELALAMTELGEPIGTLESEGYTLYKIEDASPEGEVMEKFYNSNPNASVEQDFLPRIRYKYTHPVPAGRVFCQALIDAQKVYTEQDIEQLSSLNPVGPSDYSVLRWRGSYNCRGVWKKLTYLPKDEMGNIINNSNSRKGLVQEEEGVLFDTRTTDTINAGNTPNPRVGGWFKKEDFGIIDLIDDMPVFETAEQAEIIAERIGCKGSHEHELDGGVVGFMPCEKHEETTDVILKGEVKEEKFETYNDYPKEASENACRVLRWIDEHGRDEVSGMERTGLARANSLCKREKISTETIGRMAAFERHRKNSEINPDFKGTPWKDKGYVAWLAWGGDAGVEWAQRKLDQLARDMSIDVSGLDPYIDPTGKTITEEFIDPNPCEPGYEAIGMKTKNGREVPNCVPVNQSKDEFSCGCKSSGKTEEKKFEFKTDEDKMEITGAALIPNKMIIRRTEPTFQHPEGEFYYVFFSAETIKKLSQKFMMEKRLDDTNIEHSDKEADSVVMESWIVEDPIFDKSTAMGLEYPKGTWVITMKVKNKDIWKQIKDGKLNGYSVEGWFNENLLFN